MIIQIYNFNSGLFVKILLEFIICYINIVRIIILYFNPFPGNTISLKNVVNYKRKL